MARKRAHEADGTFSADDPQTTPVNEAWEQTNEEIPSEKPANMEATNPFEEPKAAAEAPLKEEIETDVRSKLTSRNEENNPFVPTSPAVLEAAAKKVAEEEGFDLNRGTSIGARLLARSRKMV